MGRIRIVRDDITTLAVDVVVNAANGMMLGGGGVDGAIHRAAGPELLAECIRLHPDGCPAGEVRLTRGFALPARFVLHAVGPVWQGGGQGEPELLASCHERALELAAEHGLRSVSFPAISCGVYGYPWELAAPVALAAIARGLERHRSIERVRVVLFNDGLRQQFRSAWRSLAVGG